MSRAGWRVCLMRRTEDEMKTCKAIATEIYRADKGTSALFTFRQSTASQPPQQSELMFKEVDGRHFLTTFYDEDDKYGGRVIGPGYSQLYNAEDKPGKEERVPALHRR